MVEDLESRRRRNHHIKSNATASAPSMPMTELRAMMARFLLPAPSGALVPVGVQMTVTVPVGPQVETLTETLIEGVGSSEGVPVTVG